MEKLTAINQVMRDIEQYVNKGYIGIQDELQAKENEKEQIIKAYQKGYDVDVYEPEKYFNETYKNISIF